jgi:hypothetical protein
VKHRLQQLLHNTLSQARFRRAQVFLDLFGGCGRVSKSWRRRGYATLCFEIGQGPEFDLCNPKVIQVILGWIRAGVVAGIWLATPCSTWSRARRGPRDRRGPPPPLRSTQYPAGLPDLTPEERPAVELGNRQVYNTCRIIRACLAQEVPVGLENPGQSLMWSFGPLARLRRQRSCREHNLNMCQFGTLWAKPTKLLTWGCCEEPVLDSRCQGRGGICSRTGKPHVQLSGLGLRTFLTSSAAAYPPTLASAIARCVVCSAENLATNRLIRLGTV